MFHGMDYVYEVYKERSFSKAARNLYISQPALSSSIKRIEEGIGAPIFDRSTSPVKLTECGERYIQAVEQIYGIQQSFVNFLTDTQEMNSGCLSIGGTNMLSSYILPPLISEYKSRFPNIDVSLVEESHSKLETLMMNGSLDFILDYDRFSGDTFESYAYMQEHLMLAVPAQFEINKSLYAWQLSLENILSEAYLEDRYPEVPLNVFKNEPFILLKPGNDTYQRAILLCRNHGFTPHTILTLEQQITAYNMACAGIGVTYISDTLAKNIMPNPNIIYYKLDESISRRNIYLYYKRNRYINRIMQEFLKLMQQLYR
ncbi:MAG: LysR family transcriptional regulator [Candidatus Fimivivens sp.]|nr:LysR family transcriptional regulator [Candidatus Fimivivens sp.]